jgi:hypothetical protein
VFQATNAEEYQPNLLIYLNSSNMKELLDIFKKDIEPEKFDDLECVVFGFLVPAAFLALCLVVSLIIK